MQILHTKNVCILSKVDLGKQIGLYVFDSSVIYVFIYRASTLCMEVSQGGGEPPGVDVALRCQGPEERPRTRPEEAGGGSRESKAG